MSAPEHGQNNYISTSGQARQMDPQTFIPILWEVLAQGQDMPLVITGSSMTPFLVHGRDTILISPVTGPLRRGDMAFYQRRSGQPIMHRVCRVEQVDGIVRYYFVGDAQMVIEGPILPDQILGRITAVQRKGRWLKPGSFWWEFFEHIWLWLLPMRPLLRRAYEVCTGWKRHPDN